MTNCGPFDFGIYVSPNQNADEDEVMKRTNLKRVVGIRVTIFVSESHLINPKIE